MIFVTGITGLTGKFLYSKIYKSKKLHELRCLIRAQSNLDWMGEEKPNLVYGDVTSVSDLVKGMKDVSVVIHLVNIRSSPQIIEACRITGVKRVLFVNTTGMYSKFQQYAGLYCDLEAKIVQSGLDYTIIRPTMIYGNHQDKNIHKLVKLMTKSPLFPVVGKGASLMQPIYAGDLAQVIYKAIDSIESIYNDYNVAGKEPISYLNLLTEIAGALDKKVTFFNIPFGVALLAGKIGNVIPNGLINEERIQRLSEDKAFDYTKAKEELGFSSLSFSEGIKLEVEALKKAKII